MYIISVNPHKNNGNMFQLSSHCDETIKQINLIKTDSLYRTEHDYIHFENVDKINEQIMKFKRYRSTSCL
jgi:hypothetical protein